MTSSPIVFATPPVLPPPPPRLDAGWSRLEQWLEDRHGRTWNVSDWHSSGVFFMHGVKGMDHPPLQHQTLDYANSDGNRWNGLVVDPRPVWWPVYMFKDTTSLEYLAHIAQWWDALDPHYTVDWCVRSPDGSVRRLTVRMTDHGGPGSDYDDVYYGWAKFGISLEAADPYWRGDPIPRKFTTATPVPFFGPDGNNAPPFRPSRNILTSLTNFPNPGNVASSMRWRLTDAITAGAVLGFGDSTIDVPMALIGGDELVIDTSPEQQTAILNGEDITHLMIGSYDMDPLPPGGETPLTVTFGGEGSVTAELVPRYWRAYG